MKNVHISDGGADKAHIEEEGGRERSSREGNWEMRTLCHRVNNSGGIRKWSKDLGGGDEGVIKGGIQRGRRWIWDKWLFEGNGLWAIARW